jgi:broad specificity phosphatase PhoE
MAGDPFSRPASPITGALSPEGIKQAEDLRNRLSNIHIDVALTSPYGRAVQTAEIALYKRNIPLKRVPGIEEWTPSAAFRDATSTEFEKMQERDNLLYAEETWKTELGEGTFDVYARVVPALLAALAAEGWHNRMGGWVPDEGTENKTIALFAHGGSLGIMLSFLIGVRPFPISPFSFGLTGVATLIYYPRRGIYYPAMEFSGV